MQTLETSEAVNTTAMDQKNIKNHKTHVLVVPYPAQGHINPMLQFSKRLVSKGIKVTLANSIYISKSMHSDPSSSIDFETISDGHDEGGYAEAESAEAYLAKFQATGTKSLADLVKKLDAAGNSIDAMIYDGFLPWALDVAKEFGKVGAVFFTQSCAVNNIYYHVNQGLVSLPFSGSSTVSVPGLPILETWETPSFLYIYGSYPGFYEMVVNQFSNIDRADWVLFNTFYELEKEVLDWMSKLWRVRTIGPTLPSKYLDKRLKDDTDYSINLFKPNSLCLNWLNGKPIGSVVYVSFGSMAELQVEQMVEIAWGLKNSNVNFLWIVREPEQVKLPTEFVDQTSEKGLIVTWSPQLEVLADESIGCFVTHCGFNSVLEAIGLGVPMVAIPQWTDQLTNAKYVEDVWCMGVRGRADEKGIVRRGVLESCIREVMYGERGKEISRNSIKWKSLAKEAVDECGSSDGNIDEFVAELAKFEYACVVGCGLSRV